MAECKDGWMLECKDAWVQDQIVSGNSSPKEVYVMLVLGYHCDDASVFSS